MVRESPGDRLETSCAAPASALYFRPDGAVTACCASWHVLGWVTGPRRRALREIWDSDEAAVLRRALEADDFGYGCWECGAMAKDGRRDASLAASFDPQARRPGARFPAVMDFALSNRCNLRCVMCNGGLSSAIRSQREGRPPLAPAYDDRFFDELAVFLPHLERASFKGGEPLLAKENWRIWDLMAELGTRAEISVTTNGTVWNPRVARLLADRRASVNVSIDALDPELLREIRVGIDPEQLHANLDHFQAATEASGAGLTLSFCLMAQNWWELPGFLVESARRGANPNVIWVDGPERFGLLKLPTDELAAAADELDRAADASPDLSGQGRSTVHEAAQRMRAASKDRATAMATRVTLRPSVKRSPTATRVPSAWDSVDAIEAEAGVQAMTLTYRNSVVVDLERPPWADELGPIEWAGSGLDEFTTLLAAGAGCPMHGDIEPLADEGYGFRMVLELPDDPVTVVGCYLPGSIGEGKMAFVRMRGGAPDGSKPADRTEAEPVSGRPR